MVTALFTCMIYEETYPRVTSAYILYCIIQQEYWQDKQKDGRNSACTKFSLKNTTTASLSTTQHGLTSLVVSRIILDFVRNLLCKCICQKVES